MGQDSKGRGLRWQGREGMGKPCQILVEGFPFSMELQSEVRAVRGGWEKVVVPDRSGWTIFARHWAVGSTRERASNKHKGLHLLKR